MLLSVLMQEQEMEYLNDVNYNDCVGRVFKSKSSGDFKVLKYNDSKNVEIQFLNTGFEATVQLTTIESGGIKDRLLPSVYGVGIVGTKYPSTINGVKTKEYMLWQSMLKRCYSDVYKKKRPTYIGCEVSENFKYYEYFYEWCQNQVGFGNEGWQLDKDLLIKGNKVYSESTCVFIPTEINSVLIKSTASRGKHLIGVCWHNTNKAFVAQINKNKGKSKCLGYYSTEIEAFKAYKEAKENYLKELAKKWKDKIDDRAYNALMNYTVEITD